MAAQDPFLEVQSDVLSLLQASRPQLASYQRIRSLASSVNSPELREARQELESTLTDLSADLQDLVESVRAVEGDPYRYGLDIGEVSRRRKLVEDVGSEIEDMRHQLAETVSSADSKYGRNQTLADPDSFARAEDEDGLENDGDYTAWEEQRQLEMMHEQDEQLDGVFQTVGNLRLQADAMGRELEEQADLLDETEGITDRVNDKLQKGLKGIKYVIEKNEDRYSGICIWILIFVLILLLILAIIL
ncbi:hypothetical protein K431DRAFT_320603 [Polychaeton citri CBS 116435]|uniref:t-SNARE affecting a late Golgi compartment protein 1 n=1 Tax=Polychaeton citri CBS 116435 TaxID=1314669 RepID=A0A9P4UPT7_9PEZI|nr:hypothetical protein K431DRAFT_320603 [Polychaeton citri CBS 116435]